MNSQQLRKAFVGTVLSVLLLGTAPTAVGHGQAKGIVLERHNLNDKRIRSFGTSKWLYSNAEQFSNTS